MLGFLRHDICMSHRGSTLIHVRVRDTATIKVVGERKQGNIIALEDKKLHHHIFKTLCKKMNHHSKLKVIYNLS